MIVLWISRSYPNCYNNGFFFFGHAITFPLGVYAMSCIRKNGKKNDICFWAYLFILSLILVSIKRLVDEGFFFIGDLLKIVFTYFIGVILSLSSKLKILRMVFSLLRFFGKYSLEIYILHMSFNLLFTSILGIGPLCSIVISIIISVLLALSVSLFYKKKLSGFSLAYR